MRRVSQRASELRPLVQVSQDIGYFDSDDHSAGAITSFLAEKVTVIEFLTGGQLQALTRAVGCIIGILTFSFVFGSWQITLSATGHAPSPRDPAASCSRRAWLTRRGPPFFPTVVSWTSRPSRPPWDPTPRGPPTTQPRTQTPAVALLVQVHLDSSWVYPHP